MRRRRTKRGRVRKSGEAEAAELARSGDGDGQAVINRQRSVTLAVAPLKKFLQRVREGLGLAETELVICFVTDAEIARMNWAFRKKRGPTDVLSFPAQARRKALKIMLHSGGGNVSRTRAVAAR